VAKPARPKHSRIAQPMGRLTPTLSSRLGRAFRAVAGFDEFVDSPCCKATRSSSANENHDLTSWHRRWICPRGSRRLLCFTFRVQADLIGFVFRNNSRLVSMRKHQIATDGRNLQHLLRIARHARLGWLILRRAQQRVNGVHCNAGICRRREIQPPRLQIHVSSAADPVQRGTAVSRKRQYCASDGNSQLSFHLGGDALPFKHRPPHERGQCVQMSVGRAR